MTRFAVVENGIVTNIAVGDKPLFDWDSETRSGWVEITDEARMGDVYEGESFTTPETPLDERKASMRASVNAKRDRLEEGTAPTPFGPADSNARSSKRLLAMQAAAQTVLITGSEWTPLEWTMADNSRKTLETAIEALTLAASVTQYGAALHAHATELKAAIEKAKDHKALDKIDIEADWP